MFKKTTLTLIAIFCFSSIYSQNIMSTLNNLKDHISGIDPLSSTELVTEKNNILAASASFQNNTDAIALAFEVIKLHDDKYGALFTQGTRTSGGIRPRTAGGFDLEKAIFTLMQTVLDKSYTESNLKANPSIFNNTKFATSDFFPGPVAQPSNPNVSYTVKINGKHVNDPGRAAFYETEDARRPTGCYLAPGSVATVTVPSSLVGIGASVLVGAHTWDNSVKPNSLRLDRVTKKYEINSTNITIGNPLGGGIYINIPFEKNLGVLDVTLKNVVRSPYFANTTVNKTTTSQWQNTERKHLAPWTDFETDRVMFQVPTSWVYAMANPLPALNDWDLAMDGISDFMGRPHIRSKSGLYGQVDLQFRGSAFFPGYPQANVTYNPNTDYGGDFNNYILEGPKNTDDPDIAVLFHEVGHAENMYKFRGEVEALVNFLHVVVFNNVFGEDLDASFGDSSSPGSVHHTIDEAAISWMIAENFRLGNPMSSTSGQFRQEFAYQQRGYGKYADIVRLFGWEVLEKVSVRDNVEFDNGTYTPPNQNAIPKDDRIVRMSKAAGYDLTPLIHFWGVHPDNPSSLAEEIAAIDVKASADIYDLLQRYKTIVPMSNQAFRDFGLNDYSLGSITGSSLANESNISQSYGRPFFNKFWNSYDQEDGQAAIDEIQNIIDIYFPTGRPVANDCDWTTIANEGQTMDFNGTKTIRYGANGIYNTKTVTGSTKCSNDVFGDPIRGVVKTCQECKDSNTSAFVPDPNKTYYIDNPALNKRLAATGESENAYTTSISTTGNDVLWKFVAKGNGYWHIQKANGGVTPRLRTDSSANADMQEISSSGVYTYYHFPASTIANTYYATLPDGPINYRRLQVASNGDVKMVSDDNNGAKESFRFTETSEIPTQEATATIYENCNYGGNSISLGIGEYSNIANKGFPINQLSSLKIEEGLQITLYENTNFQGVSIKLTSDDGCLIDNAFNDKCSSLKIETISATIYQNCNYGGNSISLGIGEYSNIANEGFPINQLSSLKIPEGLQITLYDNINFQGASIKLTSDDGCLIDNAFNDKCSSLKIETISASALVLIPELNIESSNQILIAPNPANDILHIDVSDQMGKAINYMISSISGVVIQEGVFNSNHNNQIEIGLETIPNGIYILLLKSEGNNAISERFAVDKN